MIAMMLDWQDVAKLTLPSKNFSTDEWWTFISQQSRKHWSVLLENYQTLSKFSYTVAQKLSFRSGPVVAHLTSVCGRFVLIRKVTAIYSLAHWLRTITAVPRIIYGVL